MKTKAVWEIPVMEIINLSYTDFLSENEEAEAMPDIFSTDTEVPLNAA